jgi:hypothetical protein
MPGEVCYEIDKQRALFVTGGADPAPYFRRLEDDSRAEEVDLSGRPRWTDATETVSVMGDETERWIDWVVAEMVMGNVSAVREYLDHSIEPDILIHGVEASAICDFGPRDAERDETDGAEEEGSASSLADDREEVWTSGKTALHFAACEAYPEIVELLLERGADPNARDLNGRFPLAEAALWGRLENVRILLKYGADKQLECMRDGQRLRAVDFARPLPANQKERYIRTGGQRPRYRENTYEREGDRRAIVCLLQDDMEWQRDHHSSLRGFTFTSTPSNKCLLTLMAYFDVPNEGKTVGVLYRGSQLPLVAAMSGWGHYGMDDADVYIASKSWCEEVRRLCQVVGHRLPPHRRDQGLPGRYYACHAEKQLVAYLVHKHLFFPHEVVQDLLDLEWNDELYDGGYVPRYKGMKGVEASDQQKKLSALLREAGPPRSLQRATIMVSRPGCPDCQPFVDRVNRALGLEITVLHR